MNPMPTAEDLDRAIADLEVEMATATPSQRKRMDEHLFALRCTRYQMSSAQTARRFLDEDRDGLGAIRALLVAGATVAVAVVGILAICF